MMTLTREQLAYLAAKRADWAREERLAGERRYDMAIKKETFLKILKVVIYIATAAASFISGLQF